ncbi:MAG: hypothetical protein AMXMBFR36_24630 [Acidobacteriota bacterium]
MSPVEPYSLLAQRRGESESRLSTLKGRLSQKGTPTILGNDACIYATGSVGRGEASPHSDLDLFIIASDEAKFPRLNFIRASAHLIDACSEAGFPPFSGDGEFLTKHHVPDLLKHLGTRNDDYLNVFTARMLLLLESRVLVGTEFYEHAIDEVVGAYWRDFSDHSEDFLPIFLTNDILRYWKILCLSYEAHGTESPGKRRLRNYKLKHSRLITCYSAVLYLAGVLHSRTTVTPEDAKRMASLTPLDRLVDLASTRPKISGTVDRLLSYYAVFLRETARDKAELVGLFSESAYHEQRREEARAFGDEVFNALTQLAPESFMRYLVV